MSTIGSIQTNINYTPAITGSTAPQTSAAAAGQESKKSGESAVQESEGAVYEKTPDKVVTETKDGKVTEKPETDRSAIIQKMKSDLESQKQQLLDIVRQSMGKQASAFTLANADENEDDLWSQFANGNVTVSDAARAKAQKDVADDGYWGVEQTSDRLVEFAKTLAGNDPSKASEMMDALKKGYDQAAKAWGGKLPEISSKTLDAANKKLQDWMDEGKSTGTKQTEQEQAAQTQTTQQQAAQTQAAQEQAVQFAANM